MKLLLIGYGKMGKAIEAIACSRGHEIVAAISEKKPLRDFDGSADCAIEFTAPEVAPDNLCGCFERKIPVVCGTTGWLDKSVYVEKARAERQGALFYASNYSLGVNIFFKINEILAQLMNAQSGYDVSIEEAHHIHKKDSPSGTAITLAEGILKHLSNKKKWALYSAAADEIKIDAKRVDDMPGTHVISYQSQADTIEIKHVAHNRKGFALGAVMVAEWMAGKAPGVYAMKDFLKI